MNAGVICHFHLGALLTFLQPSNGADKANSCLVPPRPDNGIWAIYLEESFNLKKQVEEGEELPLKSQLYCECNFGYQVANFRFARCTSNGSWDYIPVCKKIYCESLVSASRDAFCTLNGKSISCESSVLPGTFALTSCRDGFHEREHYYTAPKNQAICNEKGKWEPELIRCLPVCGVVNPKIQSLILNGTLAGIPLFPWHATLFVQKTPNGLKDFICGAAIIKKNLLLTAAHCVYNEITQRINSPYKYHVATGNIYHDYDSALHDQQFVKMSRVKNIYVNEIYLGFSRYFVSDIAILEIETLFVFSAFLLPACFDNWNIDSEKDVIATFGRTILGQKSYIPRYVHKVPFDQCKSTNNSIDFERYKTEDKVCVGYTNVLLGCGDNGGGVWILDIDWQIEQFQKPQSFRGSSETSTTSTTIAPFIPPSQSTTTTSSPCITRPIVCTAPPQPANGNRQLYESQCHSQNDCNVQEGVKLPAGSHLIYSCYHGHEISGSRDVLCSSNGKWINIPVCIEIHCDSLISASTSADCTYNDEWTSCESAVQPGTIAKLSCRNGYRPDSAFISAQRNQVRCNDNGQWTPNPIKYIPESFLVTAAHCVFDESLRKVKDPRRYYVATGNTDRDYDYEQHDLRFVKKARVKHIYVHCNYLGLSGNYASDIALLEIEVPFVFTNMLTPACLDGTIIESGEGIVAGFGFTASGSTSPLLQLTTLPYVSDIQCKDINNSVIYEQYITNDKFCMGYTNGTSVCDGDSGGGILFKTRELWFLRGIVSSGISVNLRGATDLKKTKTESRIINKRLGGKRENVFTAGKWNIKNSKTSQYQ
ncbi:hypothetical protein M0804_014560 [Polistes exclamans]|nr:hypothetical protein M0804_014560 [Polistes exclamans]